MDTSFRIALGALVVAILLVRTPPQLRSLETTERQRLESRWNIALRSVAGLVGIALLLAYLWKPRTIAWAALPIPGAIRWLGVAIGVSGIAGLMWVHRELGRNFSGTLEVQKDQVLVTSGPYHWVRHPMYTAMLLIVFSFFLVSANWLIGAVWIGSLAAVVMSRLRREDAAMEVRFGAQYRTWAAHTGRLLPRLR